MKIALLNALHPSQNLSAIQKWDDLYCGGEQFHARAAAYLVKRPREDPEDLGVRCQRAFYIPYATAIIEYFVANVFAAKSEVKTANGEPIPEWWDEFEGDVDGTGTDWHFFWRQQFMRALRDGFVDTAISFRRVAGAVPKNLAEEEAMGASKAALHPICRCDLRDWNEDEYGRVEWLIYKCFARERPSPDESRESAADETQRWVVVQPKLTLTYRRLKDAADKGAPEENVPEDPVHPPANTKAFPIVRMKLPDGLWVMNKISGLTLALFNKWNDLAWKLQAAAFPQRVVFSRESFNQTAGPSYFFQFKNRQEEGMEFLEPRGESFVHMQTDIDRTENKLFQTVHQMAFSVDSEKTSDVRSGEAKRRDMLPTIILCGAYAHIIREAMEQTANRIAELRGEETIFSVGGIDQFDLEDLGDFVDNYMQVRGVIESPTWHRTVRRKIALKMVAGEAEELRARIGEEEDEAGEKGEAEEIQGKEMEGESPQASAKERKNAQESAGERTSKGPDIVAGPKAAP